MKIMHEKGDGYTLYFSNRKGSRYIGFNPRMHTGWLNSQKVKGGWEYFQIALSTGKLCTDGNRKMWVSRKILIPADLTHLWRKRHKNYREAFRVEPKLKEK